MIFTKHLLSYFVDISALNLDKLCEHLSAIGLEVESRVDMALPKKVVIGQITKLSAHSNASKLSVCEVNIGEKAPLQIVCGASNVKLGQFVAVALVGAKLPNTKELESKSVITIKKTELRGVMSEGMLCSSTELGLPFINKGILELDSSAGDLKLGKEVGELALFKDSIIELGITPNRGDCLSVLGIAREIAAYYNLRLKKDIKINNMLSLGLGKVLEVKRTSSKGSESEASLIYRIADFKDATIPLSMRFALALNDNVSEDKIACALRFGTYMSGAIFNAYKLESCKNAKLVIENTIQAELVIKKDELGLESIYANDKKLSTIGINHTADSSKAESKAESSKNEANSLIILEASYINPTTIAKALHKHKEHKGAIKADSSLTYLSTRGSNPHIEFAMDFLSHALIAESGAIVYYDTHNLTKPSPKLSIKTTFEHINSIIGAELEKEVITNILQSLEFQFDISKGSELAIFVPPFRHDISTSQDIAEEVLRIYGIDKIKAKPLHIAQTSITNTAYNNYLAQRDIAKRFIANGFCECIHYVFSSAQSLEMFGFTQIEASKALLNPITNELNTLRSSLLPHLLESIARNIPFGFKNIALFECGSVYDSKRAESSKLAFVATGAVENECYPHTKAKKWELLSFMELACKCLGNLSFKNLRDVDSKQKASLLKGFNMLNDSLLHPFQSAIIYDSSNNPIGFLGKLNPSISVRLGITDTFVCELNLASVLDSSIMTMQNFSKYQKSSRDLTILLDSSIAFEKVREVILDLGHKDLVQVYPMDVYIEPKLKNKVALSIRLILQSSSKTLQEQEINDIVESVLKALKSAFKATLKT